MKDRLKLIRKDAGLNQERFAASVGLSRIMIAHVETDQAVLSDRSIREICRVYNVNEEWLRSGVGDPYVPLTRNESIAKFLNDVMSEEPDSVRRRWIEAFSSLPPEAWEVFDRLAVEYVNKKEG